MAIGGLNMIIAFFGQLARDHCGDSFVNLALIAPTAGMALLVL